MNWKTIDLHGAAKIERVVGIFEVSDTRGLPWPRYKIKVLERSSGSFVAVANVCVKDTKGAPDGEAGLGRTEVEALQDFITRFGERLNSRRDWRDADFDWSDPREF
jgi:hypothetical protein